MRQVGEQIIQWVRKIREKTFSKRCYVTLQTVRGMGTSLQRKDFWDRLGGQCAITCLRLNLDTIHQS